MKKIRLIVVCLIVLPFFCQGQERMFDGKAYTHTIGVSAVGSIFIENDNIPNLSQSVPWGVEAYWALNTYGSRPWQQAYGYPDVGITFNYWDLQNDVLGQLYGISAFFNFYPYRGKNNHLLVRGSFGLALTSERFKPDNNKNIAVGNTVSYMIQGGVGYSFKLSEQWRFNPHILFTHISNGGYVNPNLGLNLASIYLNASYRIEDERPEYIKQSLGKEWKERIRYNFVAAIGAKENSPPFGPKFVVLSATAYADKRLARVSAVNLGFDFIYNQAIEDQIENDPAVNPNDKPSPLRLGVLIGHELFISRFSLITQAGLFIWRPYEETSSIFYLRLGFQYYVYKSLFLSITLKTQKLDTSDYVRYGIGYRF